MRHLAVALLLLGLTGCTSPQATGATASGAMPMKPGGSLSDLVGDSGGVSAQEQEIRDALTRPSSLRFPLKLGIALRGGGGEIQPEDQQAILQGARQAFERSGLVSQATVLPTSLLGGSVSSESLRRLGARFQVNALLIVSSSPGFQRSATQPSAWWEIVTNRTNYEARAELEGLVLDVESGSFLAPLQAASKEGPVTLDPGAGDFYAQSYALRRKAEESAWIALREQVIEVLRRRTAAPAPTASAAQ